ncbi:MAG: precorrin-8X methylmutase [Nitrospirota bacterium]|nr:precorrin-8X methylmutase [Nitrospirota bacterium]
MSTSPPVNVTEQLTARGRAIEEGSFAIVDAEARGHHWAEAPWQVVRRIVHATADFDFVTATAMSDDAVTAGIAAIRAGAPIVCDVEMIAVGLSKPRLEHFGCRTHVHISDPDVIEQARAENSTRAVMAMRKARTQLHGGIVAVGNAPTALLEVCRMVREEGILPALVVGVPVGFVSAAESKEEVLTLPVPHIVCRGRKGGSSIAVAALHALLALAEAQENTETRKAVESA